MLVLPPLPFKEGFTFFDLIDCQILALSVITILGRSSGHLHLHPSKVMHKYPRVAGQLHCAPEQSREPTPHSFSSVGARSF